MKTIVDFLENNKNKYKITCTNGVEVEFAFDETDIIFACSGKTWFVYHKEGNFQHEIQDILETHYKTEIRFCEECGKPYDAGFMAGDGDWYCCEECFEEAMDETYGKGKWRATDAEGRYGGYYEYFDCNEWDDTGIFYTEWN